MGKVVLAVFLSLPFVFAVATSVAAVPQPAECPQAAFRVLVPPSVDQLVADLDVLDAMAEFCDSRHDFHAQRGALLLQLQRFGEAAVALEKALLINPELAGAQLDYAQALAALGQRAEAIDLLEQVATRPDIEDSLRDWLRREIELAVQAERLQPGQRESTGSVDVDSPFRLSGVLQSGIGRESNLTGASHSRELTLYLINGPVLVPLSDSQAPIAGLAQRSTAALQATARAGLAEVQIGGLVQARRALNEPIPTQQFARMELQAAYPIGSHRVFVSLSEQTLEQGTLYAAKDQKYNLGYLFSLYPSGCQPKLSVSRSALSYPLTPSMDGSYRVLRGDVVCSLWGELRLSGGIGLDEPKQPGRPGGTRKSYDLQARHLAQFNTPLFATPLKAVSWVRFARTIDREIFSELLAQQPTDTLRFDAGFGISLPLTQRWELNAEFETNSQQSSNPLLTLKSKSVYLILRWQFG